MPQVLSIEPQKGIKSGNTLLKITGKHLACGTVVQFQMSGGACQILNTTSTSSGLDVVYCVTPRLANNAQLLNWNKAVKSNLSNRFTAFQLRMDDHSVVLDDSKFKFEYVNDPTIVGVEPERTIASGGVLMTITGKDFDTVQTANIVFTITELLHSSRASPLRSVRNLNDINNFYLNNQSNFYNRLVILRIQRVLNV